MCCVAEDILPPWLLMPKQCECLSACSFTSEQVLKPGLMLLFEGFTKSCDVYPYPAYLWGFLGL